MKLNEITKNERTNQPTAEEIRAEIQKTRAEMKKHESAAAAALEEWREVIHKDPRGTLSTPPEERKRRIYEQEQNQADELRDILKILYNNYKRQTWQEIAPAVVEILNNYSGKPYGDKTRDKISQELKTREGFALWIRRDYPREMSIYKINVEGFKDWNGPEFTIYAGVELLKDNKITPQPLEALTVSGLKPYAENPAELVQQLKEERKQARALWDELRKVCDSYNSKAPEGFEHLDAYRPAGI